MLRLLILFVAAACLLSSCEKTEKALVLPPRGTASHMSIEMGAKYENQVFFDFETGAVAFSSDQASWDLAFEAFPDGRHVFINGGKEVLVYNTRQHDMRQVTELPAVLSSSGLGWQFDAPCGLSDSTGIGDWFGLAGETKGEVYIIQNEKGVYQKMRILSAEADRFVIARTVVLVKDASYNFVYFSFSKGIVKPEPPKETWDIVFTRYRYVYHTPDYPNFPYTVTGVLLNPFQTKAAKDSVVAFGDIDLQKALGMAMGRYRDMIGYDWKDYNSSTASFQVNRAKNYIVQTRKGQLYKLRFLEFYNSSGLKGYPAFEYERLL